MPMTTQLAVTRLNISDARCLALFASDYGWEPVHRSWREGFRTSARISHTTGWPAQEKTTEP